MVMLVQAPRVRASVRLDLKHREPRRCRAKFLVKLGLGYW